MSVDNFGDLAPLAFEPEQLLPRLIAHLRDNASEANQRALRDFESGDYMPGRDALDMKSGLAAGMAVLEKFSAQPERVGNLLFAAVPDEEDTSQGMRSLVRLLPELAVEWGVSFEAAINPAFFVGRPTHAGAPFDGVNAALLAAELTRLVECNPEAGDFAPSPVLTGEGWDGGEPAPPPVALYQTDRRTRYDVTTPATA